MGNFEGMAAVVSCFNSASITRLKTVWASLKPKVVFVGGGDWLCVIALLFYP